MTRLNLTLDTFTVEASEAERQLSGVLVPYGPVGRTSAGPLRVRAGSLTVASRVVLLTDHDSTKPAGILAAYDDKPDALRGVFSMPRGVAQSDEVLAAAASGLRGGLSVGLEDVVTEIGPDGIPEVVSATVVEVSSVVRAAFSDAQVTDVAAVHTDPVEPDDDDGAPANEPEPEPEPETSSASVDDNIEQEPSTMTDTVEADSVQASAPRPVVTASTKRPKLDLAAMAARIVAAKGDSAAITAALSDMTTVTNEVEPEYLSEIFGLIEHGRPVTNAFSRGDLTSNKVSFRKWTAFPTVGPQATEKAAIASAAVGWVWSETVAKTFAGGNDVSLQEIWFDASALVEYFRAAAEAYAVKADGYVLSQLEAHGTPVTYAKGGSYSDAYLAGMTELLAAGLTPNVVLAPSGVYVSAIKEGLAAAKLGGSLPIATPTFIANPALPAGTLIVAHSSAAKVWEIPGAPVRMQVANVANAGVDVGVIGAIASDVVIPQGVALVTEALTQSASK